MIAGGPADLFSSRRARAVGAAGPSQVRHDSYLEFPLALCGSDMRVSGAARRPAPGSVPVPSSCFYARALRLPVAGIQVSDNGRGDKLLPKLSIIMPA